MKTEHLESLVKLHTVGKLDLVVLYSGGLDSTLLLKIAKAVGYTPIALLIDYGQKHIIELDHAKRVCDMWGIHYETAKVDLPSIDSALTGSLEPNLYKGVSEFHVPGRNLIFLGLAASLAEAQKVNKIWFGPNMDDRNNLFVDCYQDWVFHMNQVLSRTASIPLELEAPLLGMRKDTVTAIAKHLGIDKELVWSGYAISK